MISLYTLTLGRTYYLDKLIGSVIESARRHGAPIEHHVCFQGATPEDSTLSLVERHGLGHLAFHVHEWPENLGIAVGMNRIVPALKGELLVKMDDDCLIQSVRFFDHLWAIHEMRPNSFFSPFPVGLLGNVVGGVQSDRRIVQYSSKTDTYYTLRFVDHLGGFCRASPATLVRGWTLEPDLIRGLSGGEDTQYSARCRRERIEMFYLENAIIVEHQETALGQRVRYREYFEGRHAAGYVPSRAARAWAAVRRRAKELMGRKNRNDPA